MKIDFEGKNWHACCIRREHLTLKCTKQAFINILKKSRKNRSGELFKDSRKPSTATTTVSEEVVEELSLSLDELGSHLLVQQIAPQLNISKSSVHTIIRKEK